MSKIFAVDPGNMQSAYAVIDYETNALEDFGILPNEEFREVIRVYALRDDVSFAIEMIASYGMPVGVTVFETCLWIGRFIEMLQSRGHPYSFHYRKDVCLHLCHSARANDSNIRQRILDMYPATGGGKTPQIGTKKLPGPLYGVRADIWAALGVALTHKQLLKTLNQENVSHDGN